MTEDGKDIAWVAEARGEAWAAGTKVEDRAAVWVAEAWTNGEEERSEAIVDAGRGCGGWRR